jgi:hypothetical protein
MTAIIATEAGVGVGAVLLTFSAGSIVVTVTITVPESQVAAKTAALTEGMFADATTLQAAFGTAGLTGITVTAITAAPSDLTSALGSSDDGLAVGAIAGIAVAGAVAFLCCVIVLCLVQRERSGTPIFTPLESPRKPAV